MSTPFPWRGSGHAADGGGHARALANSVSATVPARACAAIRSSRLGNISSFESAPALASPNPAGCMSAYARQLQLQPACRIPLPHPPLCATPLVGPPPQNISHLPPLAAPLCPRVWMRPRRRSRPAAQPRHLPAIFWAAARPSLLLAAPPAVACLHPCARPTARSRNQWHQNCGPLGACPRLLPSPSIVYR